MWLGDRSVKYVSELGTEILFNAEEGSKRAGISVIITTIASKVQARGELQAPQN